MLVLNNIISNKVDRKFPNTKEPEQLSFLQNIYNGNISGEYIKSKVEEDKNYFCDLSEMINNQSIFFGKYDLLSDDEYISTGLKDVEGYILTMSYMDIKEWETLNRDDLIQLLFGLSKNAVVNFVSTDKNTINPKITEFTSNLFNDILKVSEKKPKKNNVTYYIYKVKFDYVRLVDICPVETKSATFKNVYFDSGKGKFEVFEKLIKAISVFEENVNDLIGKDETEQQPQPIITNDLPEELQEALEELAKEEGQENGTEVGEIIDEGGEEGEGEGEGEEQGGKGNDKVEDGEEEEQGKSEGKGGQSTENAEDEEEEDDGIMGSLNEELNKFDLDNDIGQVEKHLNSKQIKRTFITRKNVRNAIGSAKIFDKNNKERIEKVLDKIFK